MPTNQAVTSPDPAPRKTTSETVPESGITAAMKYLLRFATQRTLPGGTMRSPLGPSFAAGMSSSFVPSSATAWSWSRLVDDSVIGSGVPQPIR